MTATVTQLVPREAAMACAAKGPVRTLLGPRQPCGWVGVVPLVMGGTWCLRCGRVLRWPKHAATPQAGSDRAERPE